MCFFGKQKFVAAIACLKRALYSFDVKTNVSVTRVWLAGNLRVIESDCSFCVKTVFDIEFNPSSS